LNIWCKTSDWQFLSITQLYDSALSPPPTLTTLEIHDHRTFWQDDIEGTRWLELLRLFTPVMDLVISVTLFRLVVAPALDELAEDMVMEVLPALKNIFLDGHPFDTVSTLKAIGQFQFIAKRCLFGYPVTVGSLWGQ
jgi:hypothetical protein